MRVGTRWHTASGYIDQPARLLRVLIKREKKIATRSDRAWVWCGVFLETCGKDEISLIETEKNVSPGSFDGHISAVLSANVAGHWSK